MFETVTLSWQFVFGIRFFDWQDLIRHKERHKVMQTCAKVKGRLSFFSFRAFAQNWELLEPSLLSPVHLRMKPENICSTTICSSLLYKIYSAIVQRKLGGFERIPWTFCRWWFWIKHQLFYTLDRGGKRVVLAMSSSINCNAMDVNFKYICSISSFRLWSVDIHTTGLHTTRIGVYNRVFVLVLTVCLTDKI